MDPKKKLEEYNVPPVREKEIEMETILSSPREPTCVSDPTIFPRLAGMQGHDRDREGQAGAWGQAGSRFCVLELSLPPEGNNNDNGIRGGRPRESTG